MDKVYCVGESGGIAIVNSLQGMEKHLSNGENIYRYDYDTGTKELIATPKEGFLNGVPDDLESSTVAGSLDLQIRADLDYLLMFHE